MLRAFAPTSPLKAVFESAIPMIDGPSGSMANNGAVTLGTALVSAVAYANAYIRMPAGAIAAGVPAADTWYFCQMSSATVGIVYNNIYTSGVPTVPAVLVPFVTTGPGAYSGVTGAVNAYTIAVPGNTLGPNGTLYYEGAATVNSSGNNKITAFLFGATTFHSRTDTAVNSEGFSKRFQNRGVANIQISNEPQGQAVPVNAGGGLVISAEDTTQSKNAVWQMNMATATDWIVYERFFLGIFPG